MQVRMKVQPSGTRDGVEWPARGSVMDLPDDEAVSYINANMAEAVTTFGDDVETATPKAAVEERAPLTRRRASALAKSPDAEA
jgi:hypothetical protein